MRQKSFVSFLLLLLLVIAASIVIKGCSLIGYSVGTLIDNASTDSIEISSWQIDTIQPGSDVTILLRNGDRIFGTYIGLNKLSEQEYSKRFNESGVTSDFSIPKPGDSLGVKYLSGRKFECKLIGYDFNGMWIKVVSYDFKDKRIKSSDGTNTWIVLYKGIKIIERNGESVDLQKLQELIRGNTIPFLSSIAIQIQNKQQIVNLNDIQQISIPDSKHAAIIGFIMGFTVDAIIVISGLGGLKSETQSSKGGGGSCPFVYSFDGKVYVLDSETFDGAIFQALQRTDYDNLEHLVESEGFYNLRVVNTLSETQYIDELKLLVVDHPKKTQVIPSFYGQLHLLSNPQNPTEAKDLNNNEVLQLIASTDNQWWISNPFGRDPERISTVRDGLIISFQRPTNTQSVKLTFNVQNTIWAMEVEEQLLKLEGYDLGRWYNAMNSSQEIRDSFVESVKREAMLSVKIWNGQSWISTGCVWFVGPYMPKTQILQVDINNVPGNELKIQLESTAGLWMVNSVRADFTSDVPLKVTELSPETANDHEGNDVRNALHNIDDRYYILEDSGYSANLTFKAPPRMDGMDRSFILKSTGYYTIHVSEQGPPHHDLVKQLGDQPGAFGSYIIGLLNNYVGRHITGFVEVDEKK